MEASWLERVRRLSPAERLALSRALAWRNQRGADHGARIVVAYTARDAVGEDELRRHLEKRLPAAMMPASLVRLDALPRLPNGKIDRAALAAKASSAARMRAAEPRSRRVELEADDAAGPGWDETARRSATGALATREASLRELFRDVL
ncbi:MAG TPA: hypothetical protein VK116_16325, partial [Planctomycetota bacterium]|nr:hypothetical protein [Planctomycetota bacterium]